MEEPSIPQQIQKILIQQLQISQETMNKLVYDPVFDRCLGAVFGAFFGDALGSFCQFQRNIDKQMIGKAMEMRGGGPWKTKRGQLTDDSQLALHMLEALLQYDEQKPVQEQITNISLNIADGYVKWMQSSPFDYGSTCSKGIQILYQNDAQLSGANLRECFFQIEKINKQSLSNGYLMRNSPMVVFQVLLQKYKPELVDKFDKLIKNEIQMTHGNETCYESGREWIKLLAKLILRTNETDDLPEIHQWFYSRQPKTPEFAEWKEAGLKTQFMNATQNMGYCKIAYTASLIYFTKIAKHCKIEQDLNGNLYKRIISKIIAKGGDTDTNASIIGSLLGSMIGFRKLPNQYKHFQFNLQLKTGPVRVDRPPFYEPRNGLLKVIRLYLKFVK